MEERIARLKALAREKYNDGGHWMVECWDREDWIEFIESCDRYWRPEDVCLLETMGSLESHAQDIQNA